MRFRRCSSVWAAGWTRRTDCCKWFPIDWSLCKRSLEITATALYSDQWATDDGNFRDSSQRKYDMRHCADWRNARWSGSDSSVQKKVIHLAVGVCRAQLTSTIIWLEGFARNARLLLRCVCVCVWVCVCVPYHWIIFVWLLFMVNIWKWMLGSIVIHVMDFLRENGRLCVSCCFSLLISTSVSCFSCICKRARDGLHIQPQAISLTDKFHPRNGPVLMSWVTAGYQIESEVAMDCHFRTVQSRFRFRDLPWPS